MKNIAIFVSGNGTNCENIIKYFHNNTLVQVKLVLSNKEDAYALTRAKQHHVATEFVSNQKLHDKNFILSLLSNYQIDFIVLAGFLQIIPPFLINAYKQRIINIHPALLPKYGGKGMYGHHVHEAVKKAKENVTGMTIHWVTEEYDKGEIIAQYTTNISTQDTPQDIAEKEHQLEMKYFPKVIEKILEKI